MYRLMVLQKEKIKILFLCTGNSCRSQMGEGWLRHLYGDYIDAYSAGTLAQGLNPNAVKVMQEFGVDIAGHHSKTVADLADIDFDYVVTVCDNARSSCPEFPGGATVIHNQFDDPPALAKSAATEEEALGHYRRVCGEVRDWVQTIPQALGLAKP